MKRKMEPRYYSVQQCADIIAVNYRFIYDRIITGEIPATQFSKKLIRVAKTDFHRWLSSQKESTRSKMWIS